MGPAARAGQGAVCAKARGSGRAGPPPPQLLLLLCGIPEFDWLRFRSGFFVSMLISLSSVTGAVNTTPALRPAEGAVSACGTVWFHS